MISHIFWYRIYHEWQELQAQFETKYIIQDVSIYFPREIEHLKWMNIWSESLFLV